MAQTTVQQGLSTLMNGDFSYASKYETEISFPSVINNQQMRNLSIRCDSISIPGRNLRTVMNGNIYGPPQEMVQGYTFGEVSATFYLSSDMRELRLFYAWQDSIVDNSTYDLNYYKETVGTVKIFSLDKNENKVFGLELVDAFPKTIEPIAVGHASPNTINKVGISFQFRRWKDIDIGSLVGLQLT